MVFAHITYETRTIRIAGQNARVSLETEYWRALDEIARAHACNPADLAATLCDGQAYNGREAAHALRNAVVGHFRAQARHRDAERARFHSVEGARA